MKEFTQESIEKAVETFEEAKTQEEGLDKMFDEIEKEQENNPDIKK